LVPIHGYRVRGLCCSSAWQEVYRRGIKGQLFRSSLSEYGAGFTRPGGIILIYSDFLSDKKLQSIPAGFEPITELYPIEVLPHEDACISWACRRGRAALFLDTGLGKTLCQLVWADQVCRQTDGYVLILAPLAVSHQTEREAKKFGLVATVVANDSDITDPGIYITNYEKLDHFDPQIFSGVVLDESSILKGMQGKIRKKITESFIDTPYKLSCTATPSPNDFMELGTQSEFLGVMRQVEMLAMYFIHDGSDTSKWRLKGHGKSRFWEWLSSWAIFIRSPADLGFDGSAYDLPPIHYYEHVIETDPGDSLFVEPAQSLLDRNRARKDSVEARCKKAAEIANELDSCVIWCHLNAEADLLARLVNDSVEIRGSDQDVPKTAALLGFANGEVKKLITKPKIAGFGMNWQNTSHCIFVGLSDSWEAFYQAIRRQWRYGQLSNVIVHIVSADTEGAVIENIKRKDRQHEEIMAAMMDHMRDLTQQSIFGVTMDKTDYFPDQAMILPEWISCNPN
jgi:hypothetical protein